MVHPLTIDVNIQVIASFEETHEYMQQTNHLFSYTITIFNHSKIPIKLLRRHWEVNDLMNQIKIVNGEGVIGKTPIIEPFQSFTYASAVTIPTELGIMKGHYTFLDLQQLIEFEVPIPAFQLIAPSKYN